MTDKLEILVVQGTARNGRRSIHAARHTTKLFNEKGHNAELFDIKEKEIPTLENTRYGDGEHPEDVEEFGQKVESADDLVLVLPEYNHSVPGSLKNLIDYLYPEYDNKPFSYVTVSSGGFGGIRALHDLHKITRELGGEVGPELPVRHIQDVFDAETGDIIDEEYREKFEDFVEDAIRHARSVNAEQIATE